MRRYFRLFVCGSLLTGPLWAFSGSLDRFQGDSGDPVIRYVHDVLREMRSLTPAGTLPELHTHQEILRHAPPESVRTLARSNWRQRMRSAVLFATAAVPYVVVARSFELEPIWPVYLAAVGQTLWGLRAKAPVEKPLWREHLAMVSRVASETREALDLTREAGFSHGPWREPPFRQFESELRKQFIQRRFQFPEEVAEQPSAFEITSYLGLYSDLWVLSALYMLESDRFLYPQYAWAGVFQEKRALSRSFSDQVGACQLALTQMVALEDSSL